MDHLVVAVSSLVIALLTLFCGFGLGTMLLPVFAIFFPVDVAVGATAIVHLANNVFKLVLVGRHADRPAVIRFGLPAVVAAFGGAALLSVVAALPPLTSYRWAGAEHEVSAVKLLIGILIVAFALFDVLPALRRLSMRREHLWIGGLLSGFFGGLSGHQGALRSVFLIKLGLTPEGFVGTGVVVAVMVDVARLLVYGAHFATAGPAGADDRLIPLLVTATVAAFIGSFVAARLLKKVTIDALRAVVGVLLIALGAALAAGVV